MKFTSDKQRKAIFANMNKFAAKSGTGERLMPVFDQYGISEQTMAETYLPPRDIVEGYTGAMITVDRFNKNEGPIVIYDLTDKDKKEFMKAYKEGDVIPEHIDRGYRREKPENTIILAGEDYKKGKYCPISQYLNIMRETPEGNLKTVKSLAEMERELGRPVYSIPSQKEYIPGGLAEGKSDDEFCPVQLEKGIQVEMEHVVKFTDKGNVRKPKETDLAKAKEISKDHLSEIPDYYDRLEKLEEGAKEDGVFVDVGAAKKAGEFARDPRVIRSSDVTGFVKPEFDEAMMKPVTIVPKSDISARILAAKTRSGIEQMEDR
jgi:hypothetical protein